MSSDGISNDSDGIGGRIREARLAAGLTVRELARRMGVSPSHVSQVERGLTAFSVRALYNVVSVLDITMESLFEEGQAPAELVSAAGDDGARAEGADPLVDSHIVQRAAARPTIPLQGGTRWERLTPGHEAVEFIEVVYPPSQGASAPDDFIRHSSREYGVVTRGSLTVQVGFERTVLHQGDSIAFDSVTPHRFWNETAKEVRAVWFILDTPGSSSASEAGKRAHQGH